jgi:hypothetical protein
MELWVMELARSESCGGFLWQWPSVLAFVCQSDRRTTSPDYCFLTFEQ